MMISKGVLNRVVLVSGLICLVSGILVPTVLDILDPGYAAREQYLSELGADGATYAGIANWLGFLPVGVTSAIMMVFLAIRLKGPALKAGSVLMLGVSVGYLGAFMFHCDAGCPAEGSFKQSMHNLAGLIEYLTALVGLPLIGIGLALKKSRVRMLLTAGTFVIFVTAVVLLFNAGYGEPIGVWQRMADYALFVWMFLICYFTVTYAD
ncbi:MAG: hypothetical protein CMK07_08220 [Ponticaulis sp.]|nr:hypothetical protein [Ponticaulis sp.]